MMEKHEQYFDFRKREVLEAELHLSRTRSSKFQRKSTKRTYDLWNRPAPDLRMQLFHPNPPPRNSREAIQPWKYTASFDADELKQSDTIQNRQKLLIPSMQKALFGGAERDESMVISTQALRPYEAKLLFVKDGMLPRPSYSDPKPHDFRAYPPVKSLGLPEFTTTYEKDPFKIHFKTKTLNTVFGLPSGFRDDIQGKQMGDNTLRQPPKWQAEQHLPRGPYPTRTKETTRHRPLYRSPHSAFLERVEQSLTKVWQKERAALQTAA